MPPRTLSLLLILPVFLLAACGGKTKNVDTTAYTCAQFNKSLTTSGDNSAGNYINQLVKQAKLNDPETKARREITLGIYFSCRNEPGSTRPAAKAIAAAKQIKAGKFHLPKAPHKKKSAK
jgi:hypothetical protein